MIITPAPQNIERAAALLAAGQLVALPTETVYGLGADARNPQAVAHIFAAKERPADHPLIVHLADIAHLTAWAVNIPPIAYALAHAFWPGPLTLILQKAAGVPATVTGGQDTIGLRIPNHPVALALLTAFAAHSPDGAGGIAAPSANRFGRISPTTAAHVAAELGVRVPLILDGGEAQVGIESTIVDLSRGQAVILRPGMIGIDALSAVLGYRPQSPQQHDDAPRVSGALAAHYAPRTPMRLVSSAALLAADAQDGDIAVLSHSQSHLRTPLHIRAGADPHAYAHDLYANLRALDASGAAEILVETPPQDEAWLAIMDRLGRAVTGSGST